MSSLLSSLVDDLSDELHNDKCKDCNSYLDYTKIEDLNIKLISKCFKCKKKKKKKKNIRNITYRIHMNFVMEILINLFYY